MDASVRSGWCHPRRWSSITLLLLFPWLISSRLPAAETAQSFTPGIIVISVRAGSAAAKGRVKDADVLLAVNGKALRFTSSLALACEQAQIAGKTAMSMQLQRGAVTNTLTLAVAADLGITVRPTLSETLVKLYNESRKERDQAKKLQLRTLAADTAVKSGDMRAAAWLWETVYNLSPEGSPDERQAAECWTGLAGKVGDAYGEAMGWAAQGRYAQCQGAYVHARECAQRALSILQQLIPQSLAVADRLHELGNSIQMQGNLTGAREYYLQAMTIYRKLAPDKLECANVLNSLALAAYAQGQLSEAKGYYLQALIICRKQSPESLYTATVLNNLGLVAQAQGDLAGAKTHYLQALKMRQSLAPGSIDVANSLNNLGYIAQEQGDLLGAKTCYQQALALQKQLAPGNRSVAANLNNLGSVAQDQGDLAVARDYYQQALEILDKQAPGCLNEAVYLNNLGAVAQALGDLAAAQTYYQRALTIKEKLAPGSLDLAISLNNIAGVLQEQGDLTAALASYQQALSLQEKLAPGSLAVAVTLCNLGSVAQNCGELGSAKDYYQRALAIQEKLAPGNLAVATCLANLGTVAQSNGDLAEAITYYQRALTLRENIAPESLEVADSLNHLGSVLLAENNLEAARKIAQRAVLIARKRQGCDELWRALYVLGETQGKAGDADASIASFKAAVTAFEQIHFSDTSARERVLSGDPSYLYNALIQLLLQHGKPAEALQYLERAKSKAVLDALNLCSIRTHDEALTSLLQQYAVLQANLKAQQQALDAEQQKPMSHRNTVKIAQLTKLLAQTKADFYKTVAQIRQRYGTEYTSLVQVEPTVFAQVQETLPPQTILVELFPAADRLYFFLVTHDGFKVVEHLVSRKELDGWVGEVREAMDAWQHGMGETALPDALYRLYAHLITPIEDALQEQQTIVFVPSGTLCYLPFAALATRDAQGTTHYLVERNQQLVTLTQMSLLGKLLENGQASANDRKVGVLAFGNPAGCKPPLPQAEQEVRDIAAFYPDSYAFVGKDASKARVLQQAQYGRMLHFATHGLLRHDDPTQSSLVLATGDGENGRLNEGEIFGLPLSGTRLVVLSACQTAVAEENPGREISSLAQAFAIAGAPTVVASLWSVNDASTGQLMVAFYRELAAGKTKAQALQAAQQNLLVTNRYRHPYYWAGFALYGAWE